MKFNLNAGALTVTAESPDDVREMLAHYKMDPLDHMQAIIDGTLSHTDKPTNGMSGFRQWYPMETTVPASFVKPYADRLAKVTGYTGELPTMELATRYAKYHRTLCHTHIVTSAHLSPDGVKFTGFIKSREWNGRTAEDYGLKNFNDYVRKDLGDVKHEPEMIQLRNGHYKRNPNYLKHRPPHEACTNSALFGELLQWWLDTHANDAQRETMAAAVACHQSVCKTDTMGEWLLREYSGMHTAWDKPAVTFASFAALAQPVKANQ